MKNGGQDTCGEGFDTSWDPVRQDGTLWDDLKNIILCWKGTLAYVYITDSMGNIISAGCMGKYLKAPREGFHLRKDRILSALDKQAMNWRVQ